MFLRFLFLQLTVPMHILFLFILLLLLFFFFLQFFSMFIGDFACIPPSTTDLSYISYVPVDTATEIIVIS